MDREQEIYKLFFMYHIILETIKMNQPLNQNDFKRIRWLGKNLVEEVSIF